jgi:sialidase-1
MSLWMHRAQSVLARDPATISLRSIVCAMWVCMGIPVSAQPEHDGSTALSYHAVRGGLANCARVFTQTKAGRVAFLGGSITENPGWRDSICAYLQRRFPLTHFEFIAAGIASTGSTPGAFRLKRDVLSKGKVDLLFEEAAVNDATNGFIPQEQVRGMEGIVRHARLANPAMDIVVMCFVDPEKMASYRKGIVPAEIRMHDSVAAHYDIPMLNLAREVTDRIDRGEFTWEGDFKDLHPSPFGQNVYYRSIRRLLDDCWQGIDLHALPAGYALPEPLDRSNYFHGDYADIRIASPGEGWSLVERWKPADGAETRKGYVDVPVLEGVKPGAEVTVPFTGNAVGICVVAGRDAGVIEYSVDNGPFMKQNLFTQWSAWLHLPWYYVLESGLPQGDHVLRIRIAAERDPRSTGHACRIVHVLVN